MSLNGNAPASAFTSGEVVTAAKLNEIRTALTGLQAAWDTWTPTWGNLTVGNGTVVARYFQQGKTIHYRLALTFGSTTAVSGSITFTLPATQHGDYAAGRDTLGIAHFTDAAAANSRTVGTAFLFASGAAGLVVDRAGSVANYSTSVNVNASVPWTWATSDTISVAGTYEIA